MNNDDQEKMDEEIQSFKEKMNNDTRLIIKFEIDKNPSMYGCIDKSQYELDETYYGAILNIGTTKSSTYITIAVMETKEIITVYVNDIHMKILI